MMDDENTPVSVPRRPTEALALDNAVLRIEKGRVSPPSAADDEPRAPRPEHIPWGYGHDRVTAMVVDPNRLYVYWELTDQAIEKAREGLGKGGKDAWVSLRVYDITGRIFDGTNAHGYFDIKVDRSDRQWFIHIGKPASTHLVDVGLMSFEGYFVKIVRSGRADFPRFEPSPDGTVDWLTVRAGAPVGDPARGSGPGGAPGNGVAAPGGGGGGPGGPGGGGAEAHGATVAGGMRFWHEQGSTGVELRDWSWTGWEQLFQTQWIEGRRFLEWSTPLLRTSWESGPFPLPVDPPTVTEEHFEGPVTVYPLEGGRTRVVYGPWQLTIRGIGAKAEARVISRWEMEASWVVNVGFERIVRELVPNGARTPGEIAGGIMAGSSEALGASERRWLSASELRLRGASELHMVGASELRLRGASEIVLGAASERRIIGGSERVRWGASEYRLGGASEVAWLGSSERVGASDWRLGASEERLGASELHAGASEGVPRSPYAIDAGESPQGKG
jgi:hypothetical protein